MISSQIKIRKRMKLVIGQKYEHKLSGVKYELYALTNSRTNSGPLPISGDDELAHLYVFGRPNLLTRYDSHITVPTKKFDNFFKELDSKYEI